MHRIPQGQRDKSLSRADEPASRSPALPLPGGHRDETGPRRSEPSPGLGPLLTGRSAPPLAGAEPTPAGAGWRPRGRGAAPGGRGGRCRPGVARLAFPGPGTFGARNLPAARRGKGGGGRGAGRRKPPEVTSPRRGACRGTPLRRFYSSPPSPRRPGPCTGRASAPRRLRTRAAASGALPPAGAPCHPPRGATGAPTTRRPTATGLGLTAAATRPEATVSTAAAGGSGARRRGGRPRAGRRASAPGTRLPTAANPRLELPCTRSSTSARPGASRGTTRYGAGR